MKACVLDFQSLSPADLHLEQWWSLPIEWTLYDTCNDNEDIPLDARLLNQHIVLTNKVKLDAAILARHPSIQLIIVMATGTNNIDLDAAKKNGIRVCNSNDYSTESVVQHTFALITALQTRLLAYTNAVKRGEWSKSPFFCLLDYPIQNLAGKTVGIIGFGHIGQRVKTVAEAFGARVLLAKSLVTNEGQQGRVELDDVFRQADIITLHVPLSVATRHLIGRAAFQKMKSSVILINVSRGGIVDEDALLQALITGQIQAAGIDVLAIEPPDKQHPLICFNQPNLIITPHVAWASQQSRQSLIDQIADTLLAYVNKKPVDYIV